jgi:signal transduction histidine kinase
LQGDPRLLEAVLRNLLGNAWKYSAQASQPHVEFTALEEACGPVYCVSDNDIGFSMSHAEDLFRPFRRLPGVGNIPGIGIGLATVQRIIERHGGRIYARATPGEGAQFHFTLHEKALT